MASADGLKRWLDDADVIAKVEGAVRLRLLSAWAVGHILAIDPPQHISWTWDWEAEPLGTTTVVAFDLIDHGKTDPPDAPPRRLPVKGTAGAPRRPVALLVRAPGGDDCGDRAGSAVAVGRLSQLGGHLRPQLRRLEHLGAGAPAQDPAPDLVEAGHAGAPAQRPVALHSSSWLGCQRVSATRVATSGAKRTTIRAEGSSEITSQARSISRAIEAPGSSSNVWGVSEASVIRSTLKVRRAFRSSS